MKKFPLIFLCLSLSLSIKSSISPQAFFSHAHHQTSPTRLCFPDITKKHLPILNLEDMAQHKSTIAAARLLVLFLGFSCLLSSLAVPSTRSFKSSREEDDDEVSVQDEKLGMREGDETVFMERRMEMKSNDYPGTEANNHHDPRTPGRA
ncbi:uncharacterized protein LOC130134791 isoform X2 [Syzygium oleosum]|uniref:uncharacterized protein LOC130134791 isoform X2 n=1 Tax=Syzygium oleosum TaxID=219896 RepID=UPI0024B98C9A|nr:uncharacterized protein LOC130134791 isoform X2 [Syzygium oleosum]